MEARYYPAGFEDERRGNKQRDGCRARSSRGWKRPGREFSPRAPGGACNFSPVKLISDL